MRGPRVAPHVMVNHAAVDDVTGEAELSGPVAVLQFGYVEHIIRRRQTDPRNRRRAKKRAGPQKAVALSESLDAGNRDKRHSRPWKTYRLLFDLAGCGYWAGVQKR